MKILIGVPCLDGVTAQTSHTINMLIKKNPEIDVMYVQRCLIHTSREKMAIHAKGKGYTHLFFIDSDIFFNPLVLNRLLRLDKDVAVGIYNHRRLPLEPVIGVSEGEAYKTVTNIPKEPFKAEIVGTGCMLIKTSVFKKIEKPYFFYDDVNQFGEDIYFCNKVK